LLNFGSCFWLAIGQLFNGNYIRWIHYVKLDLMENILVYNDLVAGILINLTVLVWTIFGFSNETYITGLLGLSSSSWFDFKYAVKVVGVIGNSFATYNMVRISKMVFKSTTNERLLSHWEELNSSKSTSSGGKPIKSA